MCLAGAMGLFWPQAVSAQDESATNLNVTRPGGFSAHLFPTVARAAAIAQAKPPTVQELLYRGGPIMRFAEIYVIFWVPAHLQNGGATTMSANYKAIQLAVAANYPGHGLANNNTQYYQNHAPTYPPAYIENAGGYAGTYADAQPYPVSTCTDNVTGHNCIDDAQLQAEIRRVMGVMGWTGGINKIFLVYTSSGEGSCFTANATAANCAYTGYCAYHSSFGTQSVPIIYANQPYGYLPTCQNQGQPSPNNDAVADAASSTATHEITESMTDPINGTGWNDSSGNEIGDKCAYNYGFNSWDYNATDAQYLANQMWNGYFFELQMEWDNHLAGCVLVGP